ncbi:concanavalin A-like lectin/glucanase domain-containing protein [Delphinella strobiligena]|nr:concanavalin A-like lectin/glucanase domain-containing protein [Delphinella strobiligena]
MHETKAFPSSSPPHYSPVDTNNAAQSSGSKLNPLKWPLWAKITGAVFVIAVIVGIIVGAVVGTKKESYPNYSRLTYTIADRYEGEEFFDNFDFFNTYDPAEGFVHYVPEATANSSQYNLTYASSSSAVMRVDTSDTDASTGRYSVRITSKNTYDSGLFVFDVLHSPYGCSTWPALWLADPANWPENGEIDVAEAVEQGNTGVQTTLHTKKGCTMGVKRKQYGGVIRDNCWNSTDDNAGCGVRGAVETYGEAFNNNGGGIYAMELRDAGIRVWFFNRTNIPDDLTSGNDSSPDPTTWGMALADFPSTDCDISSHFKNQSIIANIDLCGAWAGETSVYSTEYGCPGTCEEYVTSNATAFDTAYWEWSSWRVYSS